MSAALVFFYLSLFVSDETFLAVFRAVHQRLSNNWKEDIKQLEPEGDLIETAKKVW
jgi:hypothetical protein